MVYALYFSPTGGTKRVMELLADGFNGAKLMDMTVALQPLELTAEDVAKITDIAISETGLDASGIKIMAAN